MYDLNAIKEMYDLKAIKEFAEENWCKPEQEQVYAEDAEFAVSNPWIDHSGRFPLNDQQAVEEWGLEVILDFCAKADEAMKKEEKMGKESSG